MSGVATAEMVTIMAGVAPVEAATEVVPQVPVEPRPAEVAGRGLCVALTVTGEVNPARTAQRALTEYLSA